MDCWCRELPRRGDGKPRGVPLSHLSPSDLEQLTNGVECVCFEQREQMQQADVFRT
jgi:hypothetical protein